MKLIQTQEYLLLIDEEAEIKYNTIIFESDTCLINVAGKDYVHNKTDSKIIAYYPLNSKAKELDLPLLPNPFKEDNIEKLADNYAVDVQKVHPADSFIAKQSYIEGYKAAQNKQFSLEDMIAFGKKCFYKGFDKSENDDANCFTAWREESNELVQSLSTQKLPKEFILSDKFNTFEENLKNGKYKW